MPQVRVYQVKCSAEEDPEKARVLPFMATKEAAGRAGCKVLHNSAQDVDASLVDDFGIYPAEMLRSRKEPASRDRLTAICASALQNDRTDGRKNSTHEQGQT